MKHALIIANTEYIDSGFAKLSTPGQDAKDFARILASRKHGAFDSAKILLNKSQSIVSEYIDRFFLEKKSDDLLLLYFSGHGIRDEFGALYLAVKNTNRSLLRSTAIKSDFIRDAMNHSSSKRQVLILDCCNSGAFAQGMKATTQGTMGAKSAFEGYGRVILTATDSVQLAWEGNKVIGKTQYSLFTHYLIEGIKGQADLNSDGMITVNNLFTYAHDHIVNQTPKQTPSKWSYKEQGEIILCQGKPSNINANLLLSNPEMYTEESFVRQLGFMLADKDKSIARSARQFLNQFATRANEKISHLAKQILSRNKKIIDKTRKKDKPRNSAFRPIASPKYTDYKVGDVVEVFCDHEKNRERARGWLKGNIIQVDNKLIAVQFKKNVYLTDGWMVPDRTLWYPINSEYVRYISTGKKSATTKIPAY